jgi:hypothetical protein
MRKTLLIVLLAVVGCAGGPGKPSATPETAGMAPDESQEGSERRQLADKPAAVPQPPAECRAFVERAPDRAASCSEQPDAALVQLDAALGAADADRDAKLAALERCASFDPGVLRALRAELAPAVCADVIVESLLAQPPDKLRSDVESALHGLVLSARLSRLMTDPPKLQAPFDKQQFMEFFDQRLKPWIVGQARAIFEISKQGVRLTGYGKGIVAIQAGIADLSFVELARQVPIPEEMTKDEEVKNEYYMFLDQALEPRKDRGRDAALVGLREFANEGILHDARLDQARGLLSRLYAGRRIDALDKLLLPARAPFAASTPGERVAAQLPSFYAGLLLKRLDPAEPRLLRALLERGVPAAMRAHLESAKLAGESRKLFGRALVEMGQRYWRSRDFMTANKLLAAGGAGDPEARLVAALAAALEGGPKDAAEMMLRGPVLPAAIGNVRALDTLAKAKSPVSGLAAFDAAYLLSLVAPPGADASYWQDVGGRFRAAALLLKDPSHKKRALDGAQAADQTARALK